MTTPVIVLLLLTLPLLLRELLAATGGRRLSLVGALYTGMALAFAFFALGHFVLTDGMVAMLPEWVPQRTGLVYLSGGVEVLVALGLVIRPFRRHAALLASLLLVLFFPANVYAAFTYQSLGGHQWGPVYLWLRAPLQLLLIGWALAAVRLESRGISRAVGAAAARRCVAVPAVPGAPASRRGY